MPTFCRVWQQRGQQEEEMRGDSFDSSSLIGAPTPLSEERTCRVTWTRSHAVSTKNHSFSHGDQLMKEAGLGSLEKVCHQSLLVPP